MILITIAVYGLFCLAYVARPGRRAGAWLLAVSILLPFALLGAGLADGNRAANRRIAHALETMKEILTDNFNNSRPKSSQTV